MRGLLLLVAATASAQVNQGFVNPKLVARNFVKNSLKNAERMKPVVGVDPPANRTCAIPLLEVQVNQDVDQKMVIRPGQNSGAGASYHGVDEKMILPTLPVCGQK